MRDDRRMRTLFSSTRGAGHFRPMLPFIEACVAAGHDVAMAGPQELAGHADASAQGAPIHACVKAKGTMRIVSGPADCKANETPLSWNQQGPQGDMGYLGEPGAEGPTGPPGAARRRSSMRSETR